MVIAVIGIVILIFLVLCIRVNKIYKEVFKKGLSVNHSIIHYDHEVDYFGNSPSYYYGDFTRCIMNKDYFITDEGIYRIGGTTLKSTVLNICGVSEYALINYDKYLKSNDENSLSLFQKNLTWLKDNASIEGEKAYWYYDRETNTPWASAISQGMVISVLVRGYRQNQDEGYLDLAYKAYKTLSSSIHEEGFKYSYDHFDCWLEESSSNSHILNGHIFALLGVYDLYRCTKDEQIHQLFLEGCENIKRNIKYFDLGFISTYDAVHDFPSNNSYHMNHIVLFEILYKISNDEFYKIIATRWRKVYSSRKLKFLGFIYTFNLLINLKITKNWN